MQAGTAVTDPPFSRRAEANSQSRREEPLFLFIEDEPDFDRAIRAGLERRGLRVAEARSLAEAKHLARQQRPDVLALNWEPILVPAFECCSAIGRHVGARAIPIVIVAGAGERANLWIGCALRPPRSPSQRQDGPAPSCPDLAALRSMAAALELGMGGSR